MDGPRRRRGLTKTDCREAASRGCKLNAPPPPQPFRNRFQFLTVILCVPPESTLLSRLFSRGNTPWPPTYPFPRVGAYKRKVPNEQSNWSGIIGCGNRVAGFRNSGFAFVHFQCLTDLYGRAHQSRHLDVCGRTGSDDWRRRTDLSWRQWNAVIIEIVDCGGACGAAAPGSFQLIGLGTAVSRPVLFIRATLPFRLGFKNC